jgi:hypothetical protein
MPCAKSLWVIGKAGEVADMWRKVGIRVQTIAVGQRTRDHEWRALRPGFETMRHGTRLENLSSYHCRQVQLPESRFMGQVERPSLGYRAGLT